MHWFSLLERKTEELGRRVVEKDLGISRAALSQVLNQKYKGSLNNIKDKVLAAYTSAEVTCPILGDIPVKRCLSEQVKTFNPSNPQRVQLYKACMRCPHRR